MTSGVRTGQKAVLTVEHPSSTFPPRQNSTERRKGAGDVFQRQGACLVYKAPEFSPQHHMNWVMLLIPVLRR